jgi:hypothetical protein
VTNVIRRLAAIMAIDVVGWLALNPSFSVSRARAVWTAMSDGPTYLAQMESNCEGLRKAGVPD